MIAEGVRIPATPLVGVDHVLVRVVIDGDKGLVLGKEQVLGIHQKFHARVAGRAYGSLDGGVELRVGIQPVVVAAAGDEEVEHGVRIEIVADPSVTGEEEVMLGAHVEEGVPLHVLEGDVDSKIGLELLLDVLGDLLVAFVGVVDIGERGEALAVGIACRGQVFLCGGGIVAYARLGGIAHHGGGEGVGGNLSALEHLVDQGFLIDGRRESLADVRVVEGGPGVVDREIVGAEPGGDLVVLAEHDLVDEVDGDAHLPVDGSGLVHLVVGRGIVGSQILDALEFDVLGIPVFGVLLDEDVVLGLPLFKNVGAGSHIIARFGPVGPVLVDRPFRSRFEGVMGGHVGEVGRGTDQGYLEGLVVHRLDTDVRRGALALVVGGCSLDDHGEHVGVLGSGVGIKGAEPSVHEILGFYRGAVGPEGILADLKGYDHAIGTGGIAFRHRGNTLAGARIIDHEPLVEGEAYVRGRGVRHQGRIERSGFGSVRDDEILGSHRKNGQERKKYK
ncbi:hypothetical protein SDC9_05411 [bioreactor metagenome]|uniref:Uncharacterized protein n=1 Tax=bioreactor metagenome TaxID=1076179 RepID=A0A644SZ05_9ZZZZ